MVKAFEKTYGGALKGIFFAVNPLKKRILKTNCTVHKYINMKALDLLKIQGYNEEYEFFKKYIKELNEGVTWADQDFKSSNHFFHVTKGRGLYGFSNALIECTKYSNIAAKSFSLNRTKKGVFYLGAACHLIQDVTVPQHVNNKLLRSHRKFELWIISKLLSDFSFEAKDGIVKYKTIEEFIKNNATMANNTYLKNMNIKNKEQRYYSIASTIIKEAERTTAGFLILFYNSMKIKKILP
ncbi:zinc dependent phospholipase C family protein [Clostridium niameyense]|uniref:zinc dependent phospholipase C family protein n=1 Tax=Clostridium niameyense TaxID=1622073 RepID=UPI00067E6933|nr:zinc dependent phospholipase C family protein [Clostridium niameyense]